MIRSFLGALVSALAVYAQIDPFANVTVFEPGGSPQLLSPRTENLPNNTILATFSYPGQSNDTLTIYRSTDNGFSWYDYSTIASDEPGRKLLQPHLLYVQDTFGDYSGGTVILAVNAVDAKSTNIEIYVSSNNGESFEFESRVASGGPADQANGATPVWEPFLLQHGSKITVYYSDQRDTQHAQKLTQQTTTEDLDTWGSAIDVAAYQAYSDRPGMPTVAKLPDGRYILTFEYGQLNSSGYYNYPVYYKISNSPENFATERMQRLEVEGGARPSGSPFVTWTPFGGDKGTIVVSTSDSSSVYINQNLGEGSWKQVNTTAGRAFSREVRVPDNDNTKLRFACGSEYGQNSPSQVLVTVFDFQKALAG